MKKRRCEWKVNKCDKYDARLKFCRLWRCERFQIRWNLWLAIFFVCFCFLYKTKTESKRPFFMYIVNWLRGLKCRNSYRLLTWSMPYPCPDESIIYPLCKTVAKSMYYPHPHTHTKFICVFVLTDFFWIYIIYIFLMLLC